MHPNWLQGGTLEAFLLPLRDVGLRVLEFTMNLAAPDWWEVDELVRACLELGFKLSFHVPYKGPYNPAGFSGPRRQALQRLLAPAVSYAAAIARREGPTPLVVHGAKGEGARESLACDTAAFLAWIDGQEPNLFPALELRVREHDVTKIGDSKADLMAIISRWRMPRGGICWDLGHDARNGSESMPPGFLERVGHVHVHDLSPEGVDHHPLLFDNVSYRAHLQRLREVGYDRAIILEVDGHVVSRIAGENKSASERILLDSLQKLAEAFQR
jgi:sugar phosphate isomerase/epimerase